MSYFCAVLRPKGPPSVYASRSYDREGDASAVVRDLGELEGVGVIASEGGGRPDGLRDYYVSFQAADKDAALAFLGRVRNVIVARMRAGQGTLIPYKGGP